MVKNSFDVSALFYMLESRCLMLCVVNLLILNIICVDIQIGIVDPYHDIWKDIYLSVNFITIYFKKKVNKLKLTCRGAFKYTLLTYHQEQFLNKILQALHIFHKTCAVLAFNSTYNGKYNDAIEFVHFI